MFNELPAEKNKLSLLQIVLWGLCSLSLAYCMVWVVGVYLWLGAVLNFYFSLHLWFSLSIQCLFSTTTQLSLVSNFPMGHLIKGEILCHFHEAVLTLTYWFIDNKFCFLSYPLTANLRDLILVLISFHLFFPVPFSACLHIFKNNRHYQRLIWSLFQSTTTLGSKLLI